MSRLIDADALIEDIRKRPYIDKALSEIFKTIIDEQPTAFDAEKVVAQLEEEKDYSYADMDEYGRRYELNLYDCDDFFYKGLARAIDIVKRGGVE